MNQHLTFEQISDYMIGGAASRYALTPANADRAALK